MFFKNLFTLSFLIVICSNLLSQSIDCSQIRTDLKVSADTACPNSTFLNLYIHGAQPGILYKALPSVFMEQAIATNTLNQPADIVIKVQGHFYQDQVVLFTASSEGCEEVKLKDSVKINAISYLPADNEVEGSTSCREALFSNLVIKNSTSGFVYSVYNGKGVLLASAPGSGNNLELKVPIAELQTGINDIITRVTRSGCRRRIQDTASIEILAAPADSIEVKYWSYCFGYSNQKALIKNSLNKFKYTVYINSDSANTDIGNGRDLWVNLPSEKINEGRNSIIIKGFTELCPSYQSVDTAFYQSEELEVPSIYQEDTLLLAYGISHREGLPFRIEWKFEDSISLFRSQYFQPVKPGIYYVRQVVEPGCYSKFSEPFVYTIVGVQNRNEVIPEVYPNPVREKLYISGLNPSNQLLKIYNLQGMLIREIKYSGLISEIDVSELSGTYMISIPDVPKRYLFEVNKD